jgi:hypothetical protein
MTSPDAADPQVQDRINAGTAVLDIAREIHEEMCVVIDDLDQLIANVADQREGGPDADR